MIRPASVLLALTATAYTEWESDAATNCSQNSWTFIILGAIGIVVIRALRGATFSHNEFYYRNAWWRLAWWASCLSLLGGIVLFRDYCGSPLN